MAVDVGGTTLKGALVDRQGRPSGERELPTRPERGAEAVVEAVAGLALDLAGEAGARALAAAVAVPGLVGEDEGVARYSANLGWRDLPLRRLLEQRLPLPVWLLHDVRAAALAESLAGAARGRRDFLYLALGTGIGAAVVLDGRAYTGAHGHGGELGHTVVFPGGPRCACGRRGCLEALASGAGLSRRYAELSGEERDAAVIARLAAAGDAAAETVWSEGMDALAQALANYTALLDPELVVIGGGVAGAGPALLEPLRRRLAAEMHLGQAPPPLALSSLGPLAGRIGAALSVWGEVGPTLEEPA